MLHAPHSTIPATHAKYTRLFRLPPLCHSIVSLRHSRDRTTSGAHIVREDGNPPLPSFPTPHYVIPAQAGIHSLLNILMSKKYKN
jgi:hypothetical protein